MGKWGKALDEVVDVGKQMGKIIDDLVGNSRQPIQGEAVADAIKNSRGMAGTYKRMMGNAEEGIKGEDFVSAVKNAHTKNGDGTGGAAWGAIAGSYMGVSAGYRVLSGGGLYKDKNGNSNLIGVPFL